MQHLMNRRSGKYLCQVKLPLITPNTTSVGGLLGSPEPVCEFCEQHWPEYRRVVKPLQINATGALSRWAAGLDLTPNKSITK